MSDSKVVKQWKVVLEGHNVKLEHYQVAAEALDIRYEEVCGSKAWHSSWTEECKNTLVDYI